MKASSRLCKRHLWTQTCHPRWPMCARQPVARPDAGPVPMVANVLRPKWSELGAVFIWRADQVAPLSAARFAFVAPSARVFTSILAGRLVVARLQWSFANPGFCWISLAHCWRTCQSFRLLVIRPPAPFSSDGASAVAVEPA
ncbi:unnamed protein product [Polarella glacialis]|uniref:Uncharacterized protein n=1 Tax=Polarella glacialis TaxID=89957 RepID=A0A813KZ20_POLGL|nr:unnamed protein product [Polarella glacialis]CAE8715667.1 unnamed protein product [Polarella glacialis]